MWRLVRRRDMRMGWRNLLYLVSHVSVNWAVFLPKKKRAKEVFHALS